MKITDRPAELFAIPRPLDRKRQRLVRATDTTGAERATSVVEDTERDFQPLPDLAEHAFARHLHVRELQHRLPRATDAHLAAIVLDDLEARKIGRHDEGGNL